MKKIIVPIIDEKGKLIEYKSVVIRNQPDSDDYNRIVDLLPGTPCGYCSAFYDICKTREPIRLSSFYDVRQRNVNKLSKYFIAMLN